MNESRKNLLKNPGAVRRQAVNFASDQLVRIDETSTLPLVIEPATAGVRLVAWAENNREFLQSKLLKHGAVLFRGFTTKTAEEFEHLIETICGKALEYTYRSTPRTEVSGRIYTSTEYPADQTIPLHNEMAYTLTWPGKIFFFCCQPADKGGETPIADSRQVYRRIDSKVREKFIEKGVLYVRNYGGGLDLRWQTVFQTESRNVVEQYCRQFSIEYEWKDRDRLRTKQACQAVVKHPTTGEIVWFNQAHLFHISSLKSEDRDYLLSSYMEEDLPRNAYYGDGSSIEDYALKNIREAYEEELVAFPWHQLDILMLDNLLAAHGRLPYTGNRKVLVGMGEPSGAQSLPLL